MLLYRSVIDRILKIKNPVYVFVKKRRQMRSKGIRTPDRFLAACAGKISFESVEKGHLLSFLSSEPQTKK